MKKVLSLAVSLSLMTVLLTACGGGDSSGGSDDGGASGGTKEIVLGHVYAENHNTNKACLAFKDYIESESGGTMTVNVQVRSGFRIDHSAMFILIPPAFRITVRWISCCRLRAVP